MSCKVRTAILISGTGSNMNALIEAARTPDFPADIALVISNIANAKGIRTAKNWGVPAKTIEHKAYKSRQAFEEDLHKALIDAKIDLICCAGFMRVLTPWFVSRWAGRIINVHPSLLPKYKGLHTHARALDAGDAQHGCTIHYVSNGVDEGAIIAQSAIDIHQGDTPDALAGRVQSEEHKLYPDALAKIARTIINR